jgi:hypothetical protein
MRRRWLSAVVRATRAWRGRREHARGRRGRRATAGGDAQLTKGLAALLVLGLSGASAADVVEGAMEFIELPGTKQSLSLSRNSGVPSELAACGTAREWAAARREGWSWWLAQRVCRATRTGGVQDACERSRCETQAEASSSE